MKVSEMTLAERVKLERARLGLTQRELAERAGVSAAFVAQLELTEDKRPPLDPRLSSIGKVATALGVQLDDLVNGVAS